MALTLRQIRYFIAVSESGKMSAAASALGVSQSAITEALKALEAEAGALLLRRHRSGVSLTREGYQFLRHARQVMGAVADATHAVRNAPERPAGRFTLGVSYTVAGYFLPPLLLRFRRAFPEVEMQLIEQERGVIESMLERGALDMGMILVSNLRSKQLASEVLIRSKRRLWLAANHRLLRQGQVTFSDVAEEPYIMLTVDEAAKTALRYWRRAKLKPKVVFSTASVEAVRGMVAQGMGVAILSDMVYRPWSLDGDRVEARTLNEPVPSMDVGLAWKREARLNDGAAAFAEFCNVTCNTPLASRLPLHE
jgi:DNA-binding transcriptional LysR family regulator